MKTLYGYTGLLLVSALLLLQGCIALRPDVAANDKINPLPSHSFQHRTFNSSEGEVLAAAAKALVALGYKLDPDEFDSGWLVGRTKITSRDFFVRDVTSVVFGLARCSSTPRGNRMTEIRLNLMDVRLVLGGFGSMRREHTHIEAPKPYKDMFNKIEAELNNASLKPAK